MSNSAISGPIFTDVRRSPSGSAAAPSWSFADSTGTGVYLASTDVLALSTAGVQRVVVDASGNVGIGTASPTSKLTVVDSICTIESADTNNYPRISGINSNAQLGLFRSGTGAGGGYIGANGAASFIVLNSSFSERMRIDSDGNLLVGAASSSHHRIAKTNPGGYVLQVSNGSNAAGTDCLQLTMSSNNDSNGNFIFCGDYGAVRMYVKGNGGIANFSANNTNLSDERIKTDINPAGSYLEKICAIPVKTFRYKDQGEDRDLNLGVIAQDVEAVAPELVNTTDGFGELPEDGVPLRTVYQTDLQYALMKCIQEQQEIIEKLEARLAALEAK